MKKLIFIFVLMFSVSFISAEAEISYLAPSPANNSVVPITGLMFNSSINLSSDKVSDFSFELDNVGNFYCNSNSNPVNQSICDLSLLTYGLHKIRTNVYLTEGISQPQKIDYTSNLTIGTVGGDKWGASYNPAVLNDENTSTFYGISGASLFELTFNFTSTNISAVEIYWQPSSSVPPKAPSYYYFSYWNGTSWVTPSEWNSSSSYQSFNTFNKISLGSSVETTKIKLTRLGTGANSGIAIGEFYIFDDSKVNPILGEWSYFNITTDVYAPTFDFTPSNKAINAGESFSVDFNATDDSPLTWSVNDSNFLIDENGTLTNNATLSTGIYSILVTVTDAFNNSNSKIYELTVNTVTSSSRGGGSGGSRPRTVVNETGVQNVTAPVLNETANPITNETTTDNVPKGLLPLTGAFIGTTTGKVSVGIIVFLIALGGAYWIVAAKRKKK